MSEFVNTIAVLGDEAVLDSIIERTITEFKDNMIDSVGNGVFKGCADLTTIDLPNVSVVNQDAFNKCTALNILNLPNVVHIPKNDTFRYCESLQNLVMPNLVFAGNSWNFANCGLTSVTATSLNNIGYGMFAYCKALESICIPNAYFSSSCAFQDCTNLKTVVLPKITQLSTQGFYNTPNIEALILGNPDTVCTLAATNVFQNSAISKGTGYVYVPKNLVDSYKAASNWSTYAAQIRAIEDHYRVDNMSLNNTNILFTTHEKQTLEVVISPSTTPNAVHWSSDNPSVAIVSASGVVTPVSDGTATITATSAILPGHFVSCTVEVRGLVKTALRYYLPEPMKFNGTSDYIDTGIQLFDTPKDFTVVVGGTFGSATSGRTIFHCMNEVSPCSGLHLKCNGTNLNISTTGIKNYNDNILSRTGMSSLAIRFKAGIPEYIISKKETGEVSLTFVSFDRNPPCYKRITETLLIGAYLNNTGAMTGFFDGTIDKFLVFDTALSPEETIVLL